MNPTSTKPNKSETVLEALDANAALSIAMGRRQEEIRDELAAVGARGIPPAPGRNGQPPSSGQPATGQVKALLSQIVDAHAGAARGGKVADVGDLERQIVALEQRRQRLLLEHAGVRQEADRVGEERVAILHSRHGEIEILLRVAAADGEELLATLRVAAGGVVDQRQRVHHLLQLAAAGLDGDGRRELVASVTPWAVPRDPDQGIATRYRPLEDYWSAVSKCSAPPLAPPPAQSQ
jgi:hypothetical protein